MERNRFVDLVAVTTLATYVLIFVGATVSVRDLAAACGGWPSCGGELLPPLHDVEMTIAWSHRVAALVTGGLVGATALTSLQVDVDTRVRAAAAAAAALYPVQVALGALAAVDYPGYLPALHLGFGAAIFGSLVAALAWSMSDAEVEIERGSKQPVPEDEPTQPSKLGAYVSMTKPRLMWLLCLVAFAGMGLAAAASTLPLDPVTATATLAGGCLAIGASGTFNHVIERDRDRKMQRTSDRPLATDVVPVRNAVAFGVVLAAASLATFLVFVNAVAAALAMVAIGFYSVVYTVVLKPNTSQNIVLGGAVGALPALIGWSAVTGSVGLPALALGFLIFLWTPAHFYNLALVYRDDYENADFPMLPVVRGDAVTLRHITYYLGATFVAAAALASLTPMGWIYAGSTLALSAVFLAAVVRLHRVRSRDAALKAFHASNAYLGVLLLAIVVETLVA